MKQKIMAAVNEAMEKARAFFNVDFPPPEVEFTKRGTTAGTATYAEHSVNFNLPVAEENPDEFLRVIVPHEIAHLISHKMYGTAGHGHGKNWAYVMNNVYGLPADRLHKFKVQHHKTRKIRRDWVYQCGCRTHTLSTIKHNKFQEGRNSYHCRTCGGTLIFIGDSKELNKKCA